MTPDTPTKAEQACIHIITQVQRDGRLAYLLGPGSQSYALLTEAVAEIRGEPPEQFRALIEPNIRPTRVQVVDR